MPDATGADKSAPGDRHREKVAVLFSGGRDSTLVALRCYRRQTPMDLLVFESGLGVGAEVRKYRLDELVTAWGSNAFTTRFLRVHGLVRRICFTEIESDISVDGRQLILLGEFIAILGSGISYCLRHSVSRLMFGAVKYQGNLPEQQAQAIDAFRTFSESYGIALDTPVIESESELSVKLELAEAGILPKSLEGYSVLADIDDNPPPRIVDSYIARKLPIVGMHLRTEGYEPHI